MDGLSRNGSQRQLAHHTAALFTSNLYPGVCLFLADCLTCCSHAASLLLFVRPAVNVSSASSAVSSASSPIVPSSSVSPAPSPSLLASPSASPAHSTSSSLPVKDLTLAGIVIGSAIGAVVLTAAAFGVVTCRRNRRYRGTVAKPSPSVATVPEWAPTAPRAANQGRSPAATAYTGAAAPREHATPTASGTTTPAEVEMRTVDNPIRWVWE